MSDDDSTTLAELRAELATQRTALATLQRRLEEVERAPAALDVDEPRDRRAFFKLAGAAAVGAVGATVVGASPAAAATGSNLLIGNSNQPTNPSETTELINPGSTALSDQLFRSDNYTTEIPSAPAARIAIMGRTSGVDTTTQPRIGLYGRAAGTTVGSTTGTQIGVFASAGNGVDDFTVSGPVGLLATAGGGSSVAVRGAADGVQSTSVGVRGEHAGSGTGVAGTSQSGVGVAAASVSGVSLAVNGSGRLSIIGRGHVGPPASGTFSAGEVLRDSAGDLYLCVAAGSPGSWRKLATTAVGYQDRGGSVNLLSTPIRILDSRPGQGAPITHGGAKLTAGEIFQVQVSNTAVASVSVPTGAKAAIGNLTVTGTAGVGALRLFPANLVAAPLVSVINYDHTNATIANGFTCALSAPGGALKIQCDSAATHVIMDITGFIM